MSRLLSIATREYLAFVRTVGFWLSICLMPLGFFVAIYASTAAVRSAPAPHVAIVDLTGGSFSADMARTLTAGRGLATPVIVQPPGAPFADLADATRRLRPYLTGTQLTPGDGRLDAAAIIHGPPDHPALDLWTRNITEPGLEARLQNALADASRRGKLARAGLSPAAIAALDAPPAVSTFSPKSEAGKISQRDRVPGFAGLGMAILLWSVILTGAGILLNSVIEEKSSRILEVLLTSASVPEIMGGKILGAAGVTATVLGVWLTVATFGLVNTQPQLLADLVGVLLAKGLLFYFVLYFVGGYLMYATLFTTIGAFCETSREAQTLLGPLMILLSIPIVFVGQAVAHPDAPVLVALSWFPPFTPFLMAARVASGPPIWEIAGTTVGMFALTAVELWIAGRAFRTGALSSGRFDFKLLMASIAGRGEA